MAADAQYLIEKRVTLVAIFQNNVPLAHLHEFPIGRNNFDLFVVKIVTYNFLRRHSHLFNINEYTTY
jgi:hypothetical protein